jgi:hypothetical protein
MLDTMDFVQLFGVALYCACLVAFAVSWTIAMYRVITDS